jgi:hypothetical protein
VKAITEKVLRANRENINQWGQVCKAPQKKGSKLHIEVLPFCFI